MGRDNIYKNFFKNKRVNILLIIASMDYNY